MTNGSLHQVFIYAAYVFPLLLQFWDVLRVLRYQDDLKTRYAHFLLHAERKHLSPRLGQRCLMARRILREHHNEGILALRKLEDSLPKKSTRSIVATNAYLLLGRHQLQLDLYHHWPAYTSYNSGKIAYVY